MKLHPMLVADVARGTPLIDALERQARLADERATVTPREWDTQLWLISEWDQTVGDDGTEDAEAQREKMGVRGWIVRSLLECGLTWQQVATCLDTSTQRVAQMVAVEWVVLDEAMTRWSADRTISSVSMAETLGCSRSMLRPWARAYGCRGRVGVTKKSSEPWRLRAYELATYELAPRVIAERLTDEGFVYPSTEAVRHAVRRARADQAVAA